MEEEKEDGSICLMLTDNQTNGKYDEWAGERERQTGWMKEYYSTLLLFTEK